MTIDPSLRIPIADLGEPIYRGSVQRLYAVPGRDDLIVSETTNAGSVFDVGSLFEIPGSDVARAVFRHALYSRMGDAAEWSAVKADIEGAAELQDGFRNDILEGTMDDLLAHGANTHHGGMIDAQTGAVATSGAPANPSAFNVVRRFQVRKPPVCRFLGAWLYDYSAFPAADGFVVPLEYIVRFGVTSASSVYRKYLAMGERDRRAFEAELGVAKPLEAWQLLDKPITDFTSKFEPEDRMVTKQEALLMTGLDAGRFLHSTKLAVLGSWMVRRLLADIGLLLWDIKWEFAKDGADLVFVDTIDTDSFRATGFIDHGGARLVLHYNKQGMRDYFRLFHGDWIEAINETKAAAKGRGIAFTELLKAGQASGQYPGTPQVDPAFIAIQVEKMDLIRDHMLGLRPAAETKASLHAAGVRELEFYEQRGKFDDLKKINAIG